MLFEVYSNGDQIRCYPLRAWLESRIDRISSSADYDDAETNGDEQ